MNDVFENPFKQIKNYLTKIKEFNTKNLNSKKNRRRMAKSFDNTSKPKGFDEYIIRNIFLFD